MSRVIIEHAEMLTVFPEVVRNARACGYRGVEGTADWIQQERDEDQMMKAIQTAWSRTSLPVQEWATRITHVRVLTNDRYSDLFLEVILEGLAFRSVFQQAPLGEQETDRLASRITGGVPYVLKQICAVCPGLSIEDNGSFMRVERLLDPLGQINRWIAGSDTNPSVCEYYGCEYPDPTRFKMECADNGQGCCYVLDTQDRLYYHNYGDLPGLVRCEVPLSDFVFAYFRSPEVILDPFATGWAKYPQRGQA